MSTDFIALMDRRRPLADAPWLAERLAEDTTAVSALIERYAKYWRPNSWIVQQSRVTSRPELLGPGGFRLDFGEHTVTIYHMMRFSTFTGDVASRLLLRSACMMVADLIGSDRGLYTHELMPLDRNSPAEAEASLRARIGPPALTFEELHAAEYFGPHAWYIDDFSDLRAVT